MVFNIECWMVDKYKNQFNDKKNRDKFNRYRSDFKKKEDKFNESGNKFPGSKFPKRDNQRQTSFRKYRKDFDTSRKFDKFKDKQKEDIIKVYKKFPNVKMPYQATKGSAGYDICAFIEEDIIINPGKVYLVPTGICISMPKNYECQVRARSGLVTKNGIMAIFGTIDSDYTDELKISIYNLHDEPFTIENQMRIAQLVFQRLPNIKFEQSDFPFTKTGRSGGFGSTGL